MKWNILALLLIAGMVYGSPAEISAPNKAAYSASTAQFTPYATATDVCTLTAGTGSTSQFSTYVYRVSVWGTQTTAGLNSWFLIKRSAADTGGTSSAITIVPHDSHLQPAQASVLKITALPTPGTSLGTVRGMALEAGGAASVVNQSGFDFLFGPLTGLSPVILHAGETLALNFGGAAIPSGMTISCEFSWTEVP